MKTTSLFIVLIIGLIALVGCTMPVPVEVEAVVDAVEAVFDEVEEMAEREARYDESLCSVVGIAPKGDGSIYLLLDVGMAEEVLFVINTDERSGYKWMDVWEENRLDYIPDIDYVYSVSGSVEYENTTWTAEVVDGLVEIRATVGGFTSWNSFHPRCQLPDYWDADRYQN